MGGAPGSSRRCEQCRQKRKRCDLTFPQCLRCQRQGLQCSGPRMSTIFVHRSSQNYNEQTHRAALHRSFRQISKDNDSDSDKSNRLMAGKLRRCDSNQVELLPQIENSFNSTSHQTFYLSILDEFLPKAETGVFSGDRVLAHPRVYSSIALCIRALLSIVNSPIQVLDTAVLALLSSYHGWLRNNKWMVEYAKSCYTTALVKFRQHIEATHNGSLPNEVLIKRHQASLLSSIALQLFEDVNNVDYLGPGYLAHTDGCVSILQLLGPDAFDRLDLQTAFQGFRVMLIYVALHRRRATLLAAPEWLDLPCLSYTKTSRDHLLDIAVHIPGVLEQIDNFIASCTWHKLQTFGTQPATSPLHMNTKEHNPDLAHGQRLLDECSVLRSRLEDWLSHLKDSHEGLLYWYKEEDDGWDPREAYLFIDPECTPLFDGDFFHLRFPNGQKAGLLMTYWAILLELLMGMHDIYIAISTAQNTFTGSEVISLDTQVESSNRIESERALLKGQVRETAKLILQATAYETTCFEGVTVSRGPLNVVSRYFQKFVTKTYDDSCAMSAHRQSIVRINDRFR